METSTAITIVPIIVGLLTAARRLGLDPTYEVPVAVALGLLISVGYTVAAGLPGGSDLADAVLRGLGVGLSSAGLRSMLAQREDARTAEPGRR